MGSVSFGVIKKATFGLLFSFICLVSIHTQSAKADVLIFSIETPGTFSYNTAADGDKLEPDGRPTGFLAFLQIPLFGMGLEYYNVSFDSKKYAGDNQINYTFVDATYSLPIPVVNLGLGVGAGRAKVLGDNEGNFEAAPAGQLLARLGIPVMDVLHINASYHEIYALIPFSDSQVSDKLEAGGSMISLGLSLVF